MQEHRGVSLNNVDTILAVGVTAVCTVPLTATDELLSLLAESLGLVEELLYDFL
jgi:hypothetical protein